MIDWLKQATYVASLAASVASTCFPKYYTALISLATFLAGLATTHPSDTPAPKPSEAAVSNLKSQIAALQAKAQEAATAAAVAKAAS